MDVQHGASAQTPFEEIRIEGVQSARGEPLEEDAANGWDEVNLNLRVMLGPRARPHLCPEAG
jgi:hypothetical protein